MITIWKKLILKSNHSKTMLVIKHITFNAESKCLANVAIYSPTLVNYNSVLTHCYIQPYLVNEKISPMNGNSTKICVFEEFIHDPHCPSNDTILIVETNHHQRGVRSWLMINKYHRLIISQFVHIFSTF